MSQSEVLFEVRGHAGLITLNRPHALNALTAGMARDIHAQLLAWRDDDRVRHVVINAAGDKAFCAGGDIRQLYDWGLAKDPAFIDFYRTEYLLNIFIKRYPKPYIAIVDGITMGGGVGISVHGSHRIATERLTFAMPETGIGLFPDVGGTYFLPRCPGRLGMFLGLTGHRLKAADAVFAGVATHFVPSGDCLALIDQLAIADDVDVCLSQFARSPGDPPLAEHASEIDRHFAVSGVEEITASLKADGSDWALKTLAIMASKSPTSQKITHEQLTRGAEVDFEACMQIEFRIVNRIFAGHDFFEGIRAVVIDKDLTPRWQPATLDEVSEDVVASYFDSLDEELPV
ncbi:MAG: enoyl-CoA hydratase/isomerase family protein [Rhizobiales bacterium]|nr:enoyl-CoA hydratase/isomerase family protein [Hyphomicrobiales bacterium]